MQIIITNDQRKIRLNQKRLEKLTARVLRILRLPSESSVGITFVSREKIRQFNRRYFKKNRPTDVIAFAYKQTQRYIKDMKLKRRHGRWRYLKYGIYQDYLGDIVTSPSVALENSKAYNNSLISELTLYIVHGILHLLGYNDTTKKGRLKMRKKEEEVLRRL